MTVDEAIQLAIQHHQAGRLAEAENIFRQVLAQQPANAETHYYLGLLLSDMRQWVAAIASYRQAIRYRPDLAEAHCNLGAALQAAGRLDEAVASYHDAIRFRPGFAEAHCNLAIALRGTGRFDEIIASCRQALQLKPELAEAHETLADALRDAGRLEEAIAAYRQVLRIKPDRADAHANLIFVSHYYFASDPRSQFDESRRWSELHAEPLKRFIRPHVNDRNPDRRLRIGYVSPDFHNHAVSRFVLPLLAAHDHEAFEIFAYALVRSPDGVTEQMKSHCDTWRSIVDVSDEAAARTIHEDQIDILVDLAGHTRDNRLLIFARKPAPMQVSWLGYPGTTGLSTMDYRFTDALADPPGLTDSFYSEKLIRLPQSNWCFAPPDDAPPVAELPAIANQRVTFGSFNNFAKLNEPTLKLWAKILLATPGSKLLLKAQVLAVTSVQHRVRELMSEAGIERDRLELLGWVSSSEHLAQYRRVDIALDSHPYHGTTTTCEALWMGVPVVSLAGDTHVSRVGVSLLSNVGLTELAAQTPEQYVRIAANLAADLPRLAELRRTLRARMQASPLMDAARFARDVEAAYRRMWRDWCERT